MRRVFGWLIYPVFGLAMLEWLIERAVHDLIRYYRRRRRGEALVPMRLP